MMVIDDGQWSSVSATHVAFTILSISLPFHCHGIHGKHMHWYYGATLGQTWSCESFSLIQFFFNALRFPDELRVLTR